MAVDNIKKIKKFLNLLTERQKKKLLKLQLINIFSSLIEITSFGLIFPFLYMLLDPTKIIGSSFYKKNFYFLNLDENELIILTGSMIILMNIIIYILNILNNYKTYATLEKILAEFKNSIYVFYLSSNYKDFVKYESHEILNNIINEPARCIHGVIHPLITLINKSIILFLITVFLFLVSFQTTLILVISVGSIFILINFFVRSKTLNTGFKIKKLEQDVFLNLNEPIWNYKEVKIFSLENYFSKKYFDLLKSINKIKIYIHTLSFLPKQTMDLLLIILIISSSYFFYLNSENFENFLPLLVLYFVSATKIIPAMNLCFVNYTYILNNQSAIDSIYGMLNSKSKLPIYNYFDPKKIDVNNVAFSYDKELLFSNLNLKINKFQKIGIVGKSGSGKSTLIDLITRILIPNSGKIKLNEKSEIEFNEKPKISYIPQKTGLFSNSIKENIILGNKYDKIKFKNVVGVATVNEFVEKLENQYNTKININSLSGGQLQRINIARGLYHNGDLIILDESTSSLDKETEGKILNNIFESYQNKTIIFSTHKLNNLKNFDYIFILEKGKISAHGNYQELKEKNDYFKKNI